MAAAEQRAPGHTEVIEYEDENGRWHTECPSENILNPLNLL